MRNLLTGPKFFFIGASICLFSCQKEQTVEESIDHVQLQISSAQSDQSLLSNTFKGPQVQMYSGQARSWITLSHTDVPLEIGIEMTAQAVATVGHESGTFALPLHHKAKDATAFEHIVINWNPHGHPPGGVFTVRHFDFHFYTITNEERLAIPIYPLAVAAFDNLPPTGYIPASYFPDPGGVPLMGKHWADRSVAPGTFTKTMIYGSYNGEVNFIEPMITESVILNGVPFSLPFAQPTGFAEHTYYPTKYKFYVNNGKYYVTLSDFILR